MICSLNCTCNYFLFFLPEWYAFIGQQAPLGFPGSPYVINFKSSIPDSSGMELMNASIYSCGDTSLGCSCGDCPSSPVCSNIEPPSPQKKDACSVRIGSLKVDLMQYVSISLLGWLYIVLLVGLSSMLMTDTLLCLIWLCTYTWKLALWTICLFLCLRLILAGQLFWVLISNPIYYFGFFIFGLGFVPSYKRKEEACI